MSNIVKEIPFDPMLAYALAENRISIAHKPWEESELCEQFGISALELDRLKGQASFCKAVTLAVADLKKSGGAIKTKSTMQFEHYLDNWLPQIMSDPDAPLAEKTKLFAMLGKMSGMLQDKPQQVEVTNANMQPTLTLNLMMPNQQNQEKVIN